MLYMAESMLESLKMGVEWEMHVMAQTINYNAEIWVCYGEILESSNRLRVEGRIWE